jgi:hypothetical protein
VIAWSYADPVFPLIFSIPLPAQNFDKHECKTKIHVQSASPGHVVDFFGQLPYQERQWQGLL